MTNANVPQLHETIERVRNDLERGEVRTEADVETSIVSPLLRCLGWDPADLGSVRRQYTQPGYRFDFALFNKAAKVVFVIEAKAPGRLDDKATDQLLLYAGKTTTHLGLTTDGENWSFYLPLVGGSPEDKLVRTVNLRTDTTETVCEILRRYLARDHVLSDQAQRAASGDLEKLALRRFIETGWANLLSGGLNGRLVNAIVAATRDAATEKGAKVPTRGALNDPVRAFVRHGFAFPDELPAFEVHAPSRRSPLPAVRPPAEANRTQRSKSGVAWIYRGERRVEKNPTEVYVAVLGHFYETQGGVRFYEKLQEEIRGPKRLQIARTPEDTGAVDGGARQLPGGWYISTHLDTEGKLRYLARACKVAGLAFGSDLVIEIAGARGAKPRS